MPLSPKLYIPFSEVPGTKKNTCSSFLGGVFLFLEAGYNRALDRISPCVYLLMSFLAPTEVHVLVIPLFGWLVARRRVFFERLRC